jgi:AmmeMemoRadiSam system protein A
MIERERRGRMLLGIARDAIAATFADVPARWPEPWLEEHAASFVTLRLDGELRGCIGSIEARRALGVDVHANARGAAYRDPRFAPVTAREIGLLEVEVSVLSQPQPLAAQSESEALALLRAGIDGVIVEYEGRRATFLPQVWDGLPDPLDFLSQLRLKAELPARFWHRDLRLSRYTVEKHR